ncbi:phytanoyl-CoA dioxygenase family protein, partial [Patescibacteria group bacterium AH-259-L07]|nr:phytanoyl-CoA dioxygenase family protein [Patescibacteria group bacterium AH-259-L07]
NQIRDLVLSIDKATGNKLDNSIRELILKLKAACARPEILERYKTYQTAEGVIGSYPTDKEGYAISFDPLIDEDGFWDCWLRYGVVVGKSVISHELSERAISRIHELMNLLSRGKCDLSRPETWGVIPVDDAGVPVLSRGFFEIYHDDILAQLRQSVRLYIHHVMFWGRADLWSSFDRLGIKLSGHKESKALPLHVDQNPRIHTDFKTTQGVLALTDCPVERGTFVGVPGSKKYFKEYEHMAEGQGEYVELNVSDPVAKILQQNMQPIPLRADDLISWDSRTTHANSENISDTIRYVAYISQGPAREDDLNTINARDEAFRTGMGSNVRDALMHASKPPRYTNPSAISRVRAPEQLTLLGKLLYGQEKYKTIESTPTA